jgi:hypothetical protein
MCILLNDVLNVTNSYQQDGVAAFQLQQDQPIVTLESVYLNKTIGLFEFYAVEEALDFFGNFNGSATRDFLLSVAGFRITARLGNTKVADNYRIIADFKLHGNLMLDGDFSYEYQTVNPSINSKLRGFRILQQFLAAILLALFISRMVQVRHLLKLAPEGTK